MRLACRCAMRLPMGVTVLRDAGATFLAVLALLMTGASPAAAAPPTFRFHERVPLSTEVTNVCNGETVLVEGFIRFNETTQVQPDGGIHFVAADVVVGHGVGQTTGDRYTLQGTLNINAFFPPGPIIMQQRTKVISSNPDSENFFATFVFIISGNGEQTRVDIQTDCRG
jgi:hypothetical protein